MGFKKILLIVILILLIKLTFTQTPGKTFHSNTVWMLLPSVKYDAFCLLNTLVGDEFYTNYYPTVFKHYDSLSTPAVRKSLENLKQYKNKRGMILSAFLCNAFYQLPDSSLKGVLENIRDKSKMKGLL